MQVLIARENKFEVFFVNFRNKCYITFSRTQKTLVSVSFVNKCDHGIASFSCPTYCPRAKLTP